MIRNQAQQYIYDRLKNAGIRKGAINLYLDLLDRFDLTNEYASTTKMLAERHDVTERSIQRYMNELTAHSYIHVRPHYKKLKKDPSKSFIEYNTYVKTPLTIDLEEKAKNYSNRDTAVFFKKGVFD